MKIQVYTCPGGDDDCRRVSFHTVVNGTEYDLAWECLEHSEYTRAEVLEEARKRFGPDTEIEYVLR